MGTSHRHTPSVTGKPNWGKASKSVTSVAKAVDASEKLQNNPPPNMPQKSIDQKQGMYEKRIINNTHKAVHNLVRAAGGRNKVANGSSKAIGRGGISSIGSWVGLMTEIHNMGFQSWLQTKGISSLHGKTCREIVETISSFLDENTVSLDDTAAKEALEHVMELIENKMDNNPDSFEDVINSIMTTDEIKDYIDQFFGVYIYSHLSQDFSEKLEKTMGTEIMNKTMDEIKDLILDDVKRGCNGRSADKIDWTGKEGKQFIKEEFERIILILSGDED